MEIIEETLDDFNSRYARAMLPITIVFGLFAIVGVVGNVFVIVIFLLGRIYKNSNFRVFVICLGIIDLLTCAVKFPLEIIKQRNYFSFSSTAMCKTYNSFNFWTKCAAMLILFFGFALTDPKKCANLSNDRCRCPKPSGCV